MFVQVTEFQHAFGQLVADVPALPEQPIRDLRIRLLVEEFDELADAIRAHDLVEIADALADMAYIICGTVISYGTVPTSHDLFFQVGPIGCPHFPDNMVTNATLEAVSQQMGAYLRAEEGQDLTLVDVNLMTLLGSVVTAAQTFHIPLQTVFNEVHRSNMSKLGEDGKPVYREDGKVMKGPRFFRPDIAAILAAQG